MPAQSSGRSSILPRRGVLRRLAGLLVVSVALLASTVGCAAKPKHRVTAAAAAPKPWMRAQSLCIFPMSRSITAETPDKLASSMEKGWGERLNVPEGSDLVRMEGVDHFPRVESMTIDLSDVTVPTKRKEQRLKPVGKPEGSLHVENLEFVARPLLVEKARLLIGMTASDARLDVRRDKRGRPMLTLSGAQDGRITMEVSRKDIDDLLLESAREEAGKYGVAVDRIRLKLNVVDNRSLRVDLKADVRIGTLLPAGLRFRARMDVDDDLNGRITKLSCDGDQLLGPLISSIIDPQLNKYEGKKRPLVGFVYGKMKLRDLSINVDDGFKLDAGFGNVASAKVR
jgi:hypothetical protein